MRIADRGALYSRSDIWIFIAMVFLSLASVTWVYSSAIDSFGKLNNMEWVKQIVWITTGYTMFFFLSLFDYTRLRDFSIIIYAITILLLILVLVVGAKVNGSKSWLGFGPFGIQPAELAKFAVLVNLAVFLDSQSEKAEKLSSLVFMFLIILPPLVLILLQPDAGSASILIAIFFCMAFLANANIFFILNSILIVGFTAMFMLILVWNKMIAERSIWFANILSDSDLTFKFLIFLMILFVVSIVGIIRKKSLPYKILASFSVSIIIATGVSFLGNIILKPYQMMRLATFMRPNLDTQGAGYQIIQSINAVGSGGIWGKGFLKGNHSHLQYLPEQSTDFIFSIISEEAGFLGSFTIILLLGIILIRILLVSQSANNNFGKYICYGVFSIFFFHTLINVGMVIGLVPITGIPLLLVSYGGSSILLSYSMLGIINSIYLRRIRN